jgi:hypothetical protein
MQISGNGTTGNVCIICYHPERVRIREEESEKLKKNNMMRLSLKFADAH